MKKNISSIIAFLVFSFLLSATTLAEEVVEDGTYILRNGADLDMVASVMASFWDDIAILQCETESGKNCQKFTFTRQSDGKYTIRAAHSNKYVEIEREQDKAEDHSGALRQYGELRPDGVWNLISIGNNCYQIQAEDGRCIGAEGKVPGFGTALVMNAFDNQDMSQVWLLVPTEVDSDEVVIGAEQGSFVNFPDGVYEFSAFINGQAHWNMSSDDTPLALAGDVGDSASKYILKKERETDAGDTMYSIRPYDNPNIVLQRNYMNYIEEHEFVDNSGAQLWQFVYCGWGEFLIRCVDEGVCACYQAGDGLGSGIITVDYSSVDESQLKWAVKPATELRFY